MGRRRESRQAVTTAWEKRPEEPAGAGCREVAGVRFRGEAVTECRGELN